MVPRLGPARISQTGLPTPLAGLMSRMLQNSEQMSDYDLIILGTSTWGDGEVQDDWYDALNTLKGLSLSGKKVAIFGVGDSESYPDTFCGGMKALYDAACETGAEILPGVDASAYNYSASDSVVNGKFVGLALDETNEADKTDGRISSWVATL